jgi:hypothetical protein
MTHQTFRTSSHRTRIRSRSSVYPPLPMPPLAFSSANKAHAPSNLANILTLPLYRHIKHHIIRTVDRRRFTARRRTRRSCSASSWQGPHPPPASLPELRSLTQHDPTPFFYHAFRSQRKTTTHHAPPSLDCLPTLHPCSPCNHSDPPREWQPYTAAYCSLVVETMGYHKDWKKTPKHKERCKSYEAEVLACMDEMERIKPGINAEAGLFTS